MAQCLYVDLDGVLGDFDRHYDSVFGVTTTKKDDNVNWKAVREYKGFYYDMPPMPDMATLWSAIAHLDPIVLTGIPASVTEAESNKRSWVERHLGKSVPVICCLSREKYKYCRHGDILIDDWEKHKQLWLNAGGIWITYISATNTVNALRTLGVAVR